MEKAAEPLATADAIERQWFSVRRPFVYRRRFRERWPLAERAMRPVLVVVLRVDAHHALEMAAAEDQQPVETRAAQTANPALGMRSRPWRPHWPLITRIPSVRKTSSTSRVNLLSRSRIR